MPKGLEGKKAEDIPTWEREFVEAWESQITYLQPMAKDPGFEAESEYRILHTYAPTDRELTVILQKNAMMTRHVPLALPKPDATLLPIEKVMGRAVPSSGDHAGIGRLVTMWNGYCERAGLPCRITGSNGEKSPL